MQCKTISSNLVQKVHSLLFWGRVSDIQTYTDRFTTCIYLFTPSTLMLAVWKFTDGAMIVRTPSTSAILTSFFSPREKRDFFFLIRTPVQCIYVQHNSATTSRHLFSSRTSVTVPVLFFSQSAVMDCLFKALCSIV